MKFILAYFQKIKKNIAKLLIYDNRNFEILISDHFWIKTIWTLLWKKISWRM